MKRTITFLLIISLCLPMLFSCGKEQAVLPTKTPEAAESFEVKDNMSDQNSNSNARDILFLGDDLMETSKVYDYFDQLCHINGQNDVDVHYYTIEDARMYTYAEMCQTDKDFAAAVADAEVILFEEGTAETVTTVESVTTILEYANDPMVVCISYYGYPRWMHRNLFYKSHPEFKYADANTAISGVIAAEPTPIGFEHLYHEDYIHPNELNGYMTAVICYGEVYGCKADAVSFEGLEKDEGLLASSPVKDSKELYDLLSRLREMLNKYMR